MKKLPNASWNISLEETVTGTVVNKQFSDWSIRRIVEPLNIVLQKSIPFQQAYDPHKISAKHHYYKEMRSNQLWSFHRVPTFHLLQKNNDTKTLTYAFVDKGTNLHQYFTKNDDVETFVRFLEFFNTIRFKALRKDYADFLHSEPSLRNWMYLQPTRNRDNSSFLAIDNEFELRTDLSVEKLDTLLLTHLLQSVVVLDKPEELLRRYVQQFTYAVGHKKVDEILGFNYAVSPTLQAYGFARSAAVSVFGLKANQPPRWFSLFEKRYDAFVRDQLETR